MEAGRMQRLVMVMGRMAGGDRAAPWALFDEFGADIAAAVRHHGRTLGAALSDDDVHGLVIDVCTMLAERAGSWRPEGGATPWTWAAKRIAAMVGDALGQRADGLDEAHHDAVVAGPVPASYAHGEPDALAVLERVAARDELAALFHHALCAAGSERNRRVLLEVRLQASLGDPSPSVTVGGVLGLSPDAVRQICKRTTDRLQVVVRSDPRFAPLDGVSVLLQGPRRKAGHDERAFAA